MKSKKIILPLIFVFLLIGSFSRISLLQAETGSTPLSLIAPYNSDILIDGSLEEWDNGSLKEIYLYQFEPHDPPVEVRALINFAYDDTFLYGFIFIPDTEGQVYATELIFFGREEQGETLDGVFMNASDNRYQDHAFESFFTEPFDDESNGGENNVYAASQIKNSGSVFEFKKDIESTDTNGYDFNLGYGNSIGVFVVAWINTTEEGGPNWGMGDAAGFHYIRLSIGTDNGDYIKEPVMEEKINWIRADQPYYCRYESAVNITYDGVANENFWQEATVYHVTLYFINWETNEIDEGNRFDGEIRFVTDGVTLYVYFEIYDTAYEQGDANLFLFGETENMFEVEKGIDMVYMTPDSYEDMVFDSTMGEPMKDEDMGGTIDGLATVIYDDNMRKIEFSKPLDSGDINDFQAQPGDTIYFSNIAQYQSEEGPNYFDAWYNNESIPAIIVYPLVIMQAGEQPPEETDGTNTESVNTFPLDYSVESMLSGIIILTLVATTVRLKRKKV